MSDEQATGPQRRRRRRVASRPAGAPEPTTVLEAPAEEAPAVAAPAVGAPAVESPPASPPVTKAAGAPRQNPKRGGGRPAGGRRSRDGDRDGGLRDLTGAGPSKVGVGGAMRARDVNRPTADDLAEAERDIVIVRRQWKPDTTH